MPDKPSRNEEEYFARMESDRLKAMRQQADHEARSTERRSHFMKCPRCGADLRIEHFQGIEVERCPECQGLWFDHDEAHRLVDLNAKRGVGGLFRAIVDGVMGPTKAKKPGE
jgi:hypothetical protein